MARDNTFVIVGGGLTAAKAAEGLRDSGFEATSTSGSGPPCGRSTFGRTPSPQERNR